jgi:hypothetical protein
VPKAFAEENNLAVIGGTRTPGAFSAKRDVVAQVIDGPARLDAAHHVTFGQLLVLQADTGSGEDSGLPEPPQCPEWQCQALVCRLLHPHD